MEILTKENNNVLIQKYKTQKEMKNKIREQVRMYFYTPQFKWKVNKAINKLQLKKDGNFISDYLVNIISSIVAKHLNISKNNKEEKEIIYYESLHFVNIYFSMDNFFTVLKRMGI